MDRRQDILRRVMEDIAKHGDIASNREVFFIMKTHMPYDFKSQEECDNSLALLLQQGRFKRHLLFEENAFPFSKKLKKAMNTNC